MQGSAVTITKGERVLRNICLEKVNGNTHQQRRVKGSNNRRVSSKGNRNA